MLSNLLFSFSALQNPAAHVLVSCILGFVGDTNILLLVGGTFIFIAVPYGAFNWSQILIYGSVKDTTDVGSY